MNSLIKDKKNTLPHAQDNQRRPFFSFQQDVCKPNTFFGKANNISPVHIDGLPGNIQKQNAPTSPQTTPCPTSVSIGSLTHFNHGNLSPANKEKWGTYLEVTSKMDVGPGPDHTGHCMKERLTTISNTCPAQVYSRGGGTDSQPCTGNRCLDINRFGAGPTAFIDMHRTRHPSSLLEGSGVNSCSVVCEQIYLCDRINATSGKFRITRNFQAGTYTKSDGTTMHITTGDVQKDIVQSTTFPHGPLGDFEVTEEIKHTA